MKKGAILFLYAVALSVILRRYYKTESGLPKPSTIVGASYLYGILALSADFLETVPLPFAAILTVALIWRTQATETPATTATKKPTTSATKTPVKKAG